MRFRLRSRYLWQFAGVLVAVVVFEAVLSVAFYDGITHAFPGANDFYVPWRATQALAREGLNPYSAEVTRSIQLVMFGHLRAQDEHQFAFAYPLYASLLIVPLVWLPYDAAEAIWLALQLTLLLASVYLCLDALDWKPPPLTFAALIVWSIAFYPSARSLILGQLSIFTFACVAFVWWALRDKRWYALAGVALALSTIKPQVVFLVVPLLLLWATQREYARVWQGFVLTIVGLLVVSFLWLPTWPADFADSLRAYWGYTEVGSPSAILFGDSVWRVLLDLAMVACLVFFAARERTTGWAHFATLFALTLIVSQVVAPRTGTTNQIVLILPLFALIRRQPRQSQWAVLLVTLLAPWVVFFATLRGNVEQPPVYVVLPYLILVLFAFESVGLRRRVQVA